MADQATQTLPTQSVQSFMKENNYTQIGGKMVRANSNEYPYVTFINDKNVAENIYFSKGASQLVTKGQEIARGFFDDFAVAMVINKAAGKELPKLVRVGEGNRLDIEDLF